MRAGIEMLSEIPPEKRQEFIQSFKILPHFEGCKNNCIFYRLFEDIGEVNRFLWVEHWSDKSVMEKYLQSDRFKTIQGAVDTMGELIRFIRIQFEEIVN